MNEYLKHYAENKSQTEKNTCDTVYLKLQGRKSNTLIKSRSMSSKAEGWGKLIRWDIRKSVGVRKCSIS